MNTQDPNGPFMNNRVQKLRSAFAVSVALLLILTAIAKLIAILQQKPFLTASDGLIPHFTYRDSFIVAIIIEIFVSVFVFVRRRHLFSMVISFWLVAGLLTYRLTKYFMGVLEPCNCLGGVLDWTKIPKGTLNLIPLLILCYIGIGSLIFLFRGGTPLKAPETTTLSSGTV